LARKEAPFVIVVVVYGIAKLMVFSLLGVVDDDD